MIVLDTSVIIASLAGPKPLGPALREVIGKGERLLLPSIALYEWLRGPRLDEELAMQEALFPRESTLPFGPLEAEVAARLYKMTRRPRKREIDIAIAAYAIVRDAQLWTLNVADFRQIPDLRLYQPA